MKNKITRETYFAILIGKAPKHSPYFMLGSDKSPRLFDSKEDAKMFLSPGRKIVRVELREIKPKRKKL